MIFTYTAYEFAVLIFIVVTFILSAGETSIITANPIKLQSLSEKGSRGAARALHILENIEDAMGMMQILINTIEISTSAFIAFVATKAFLINETQLLIVAAIQTVIFLTFCEILPKVIARTRPESILIAFSSPIRISMMFFRPVTRFALFYSKKIKDMLNLSEKYSFISSRDDIGLLFKIGVSEGIIDKKHHSYIDEILTFNQVTAYEVMTPLIDVVSIERRQSIRHLIKLIDETKYSRIPVFDGRVDNMTGYIYYRDLMGKTNTKNIDELVKKPFYIPSTKKIYSLFLEMQDRNIPIAFVVNEFGAVEGIVTKEDIAEEIVGEIQTRDHHNEDLIQKISARKYLIRGNLDIDFFQRRFGVTIEKKGFETLAGFITSQLGRIPNKGDRLVYQQNTIIVEEATERSVERVLLISHGAKKE